MPVTTATRTAGAHCRWAPKDVDRLISENGLRATRAGNPQRQAHQSAVRSPRGGVETSEPAGHPPILGVTGGDPVSSVELPTVGERGRWRVVPGEC